MNRKTILTFIAIYGVAAGLGYFLSGDRQHETVVIETASYILQGETTEAAVQAVRSVEGKVTHEFAIINAVAAKLDKEQLDRLLVDPAILAINEDTEANILGGVAGGASTTHAEFPAPVVAGAL